MQTLDLFAATPHTALSLAAVARELDLNRSTCLGILNELVHVGYLIRERATATYRLGPSMLRVGLAAIEARPALTVLQQQVEQLTAHLDVDCGATAIEDGMLVVVDLVRAAGLARDARLNIGVPYPYEAPIGLPHAVWEDEDGLRAWFERSPTLPRAEVERLWAVIESSRGAGFFVKGLTTVDMLVTEAYDRVTGGVSWNELHPGHLRQLDDIAHVEYLHSEITDAGRFAVSLISAPVMSSDRRPAYVVYARMMSRAVTGREIRRVGRELVAACRTVEGALAAPRAPGGTGAAGATGATGR